MDPEDRPFFVRRCYIEHGYRADGFGMTFKQCTQSLYSYIHNESMNVVTHLLPAVYFTVHIVLDVAGASHYEVLHTWQSKFLMALAGLGCSFDMWTSVAFHLYNTMGAKAS